MELSALFGGLTGLLGTGMTYAMDYFKAKQEAEAKAQEAQANKEIAELELQKAQVLAASNVQVAVAQGDNAAVTASYESDKATYVSAASTAPIAIQYLLGIVDFLRGFIRPGTTIGYGVLFAWLVTIAVGALGVKALADAQAASLVDAAIYLATSTTMWWFGVRPMAKK
jgi:hypothetical protein